MIVLVGACAGTRPGAGKGSDVTDCADQAPLSGQALTVVITVSAPSDKQWLFDEAPAMVAGELLTDLNALGSISFSEANGEEPNLYLNVTLNQETQGTEQDTAYVEASGLGHGVLFHDTSGASPFTSTEDALTALAANINSWLVSGWTTTAACRLPDGSIRPAG